MGQRTGEQKFVFLLVGAMAVWGFSWSAGKTLVHQASDETVLYWRFLITFLSFLPVVFYSRANLKVSFSTFLLLLGAALVYALYNLFFLMGLRRGQAGAGGVLVTTLNPLITFLLAIPFLSRRLHRREWLGLALGVPGGLLMLQKGKLDPASLLAGGNLYFVLAALSWSLVSFSSRILKTRVSIFTYGYYVYGLSFLMVLPLVNGVSLNGPLVLGGDFWGPLTYLAVFSTSLGTTVYFTAAARLGPATASSFIFLVPVTALLGAMLFLGEIPGISTVLGGILAIAAVSLINWKPNPEQGRGAKGDFH